MPEMTFPERDSFWSKVAATANPKLCWEWKAGKGDSGYGSFTFKNKEYKSHRISYYLHYGVDPGDKLVCHSCDNRACSNPAHYFLGTDLDNAHDKIAKGRAGYLKGEEHGIAKLTDSDIMRIRELCNNGVSSTILSKEYEVGVSQIRRIATGQSWKHLPNSGNGNNDNYGEYKTKGDWAVGTRHGHARMTEQIVLEMRKDHKDGMSVSDISRKYNIHQSGASRIINRDRWKHI
jgi:Mor family transcriptional regulator